MMTTRSAVREDKLLEERIFDHFCHLKNQAAVAAHLPEGWRVQVSTFYEGGVISLFAKGTQVLEIEIEAEFRRKTISVPEVLDVRRSKLLRFVADIGDKIHAEVAAEKRAREVEAAALVIAEIDAAIDELPEPGDHTDDGPRPT